MYTMSNEALAAADMDLKSSGLHISENLSQRMYYSSYWQRIPIPNNFFFFFFFLFLSYNTLLFLSISTIVC